MEGAKEGNSYKNQRKIALKELQFIKYPSVTLLSPSDHLLVLPIG